MESTIQFLIIVLLIEVVPGTNILFALFQSSLGHRHLFVGILGLLTANLLWITLVATGLALVIKNSPVMFESLRWFGVAYLSYLGFKIIRHGIRKPQVSPSADSTKSYWESYVQGVLTSLSNPKALLFFLALFPHFVDEASYIFDLAYFGFLKMLCLFLVASVYGLAGERLFKHLAESGIGDVFSKILGGGIILGAIGIARSQ